MNWKRKIAKPTGFVVLVGALAFFLLSVRGARNIQDVWDGITLSFAFGFSAYAMWLGKRAIDWASGRPEKRHVKWGRVLFGAWLVFSSLKNHIHPAPNLLKASNAGEAVGMAIGAIAIALVGAWLIISGIQNRFSRQQSSSVLPSE